MGFLILGLLLIALKLLALGPVADWSWWAVLSPLVAAALWWQWSDVSGLTRRHALDREAKRAKARRDERARALGLGVGSGTRDKHRPPR